MSSSPPIWRGRLGTAFSSDRSSRVDETVGMFAGFGSLSSSWHNATIVRVSLLEPRQRRRIRHTATMEAHLNEGIRCRIPPYSFPPPNLFLFPLFFSSPQSLPLTGSIEKNSPTMIPVRTAFSNRITESVGGDFPENSSFPRSFLQISPRPICRRHSENQPPSPCDATAFRWVGSACRIPNGAATLENTTGRRNYGRHRLPGPRHQYCVGVKMSEVVHKVILVFEASNFCN